MPERRLAKCRVLYPDWLRDSIRRTYQGAIDETTVQHLARIETLDVQRMTTAQILERYVPYVPLHHPV